MQQEYEMKSSATPLLNNLQSFLLLCCITFIDLRCCVWNISSTIGCATGTNQPLWSGYTIGPRGMSSANITAASILFPPTEMYAQPRLFTCSVGLYLLCGGRDVELALRKDVSVVRQKTKPPFTCGIAAS